MTRRTIADIDNLVDGVPAPARDGRRFTKRCPSTGELAARVARSGTEDVARAVAAAAAAQPAWAARTPVERGAILRRLAQLLERDAEALAAIVADETGKALDGARGEVGGAIEMGYFVAGEGRRLYGRTMTSAVPHRQAYTVRQPLGVAALIIAANTPIANVAWKAFPALLCGNAAVLKAAEDAPATAVTFARLALEAGVPPGVLNVIHGLGQEAGTALVAAEGAAIVSFTGSTAAGRQIAAAAGARLAKVCLELGGKNPFVVCDDADLAAAAAAAAASAFSNAGQRCAAGSRILVFEGVYDAFRDLLLAEAAGTDPGPVINARQMEGILGAVEAARGRGARLLCGGHRVGERGCFIAPTLLDGVALDDPIAQTELFGPVATLHPVADLDAAIAAANATAYGLTAAIWTASVHRGQRFAEEVRSGLAAINGPTFGSEPHWPFGGLGASGTGWREAGTEALDVYSDLKAVHVTHDPGAAR
jgi:acyl-CoA reductase-like NAD-dependent aldehyde dehydrogenase